MGTVNGELNRFKIPLKNSPRKAKSDNTVQKHTALPDDIRIAYSGPYKNVYLNFKLFNNLRRSCMSCMKFTFGKVSPPATKESFQTASDPPLRCPCELQNRQNRIHPLEVWHTIPHSERCSTSTPIYHNHHWAGTPATPYGDFRGRTRLTKAWTPSTDRPPQAGLTQTHCELSSLFILFSSRMWRFRTLSRRSSSAWISASSYK